MRVLNDESNRRKSLQRSIIRYLVAHPGAADSASGVRHCWLRGEADISQPMVEHALEDLLNRGLLVKRGDTPATRIYAFNEVAGEAARAFSEEPDENAGDPARG